MDPPVTGGFVSPVGLRRFVQATDREEGAQRPFEEEDQVILIPLESESSPQVFPVTLAAGKTRVEGLGVVDTGRLMGRVPGSVFEIASRRFLVLRPDLRDHQALLRRKAQLVLPKDAAQIIMGCAIGPGSRVAEAGVGSGGLTLALAWAVGDDGMVYAYEIREDHLQAGRRNLERSGLIHRVRLHHRDISAGIEQRCLDAVVLDLPEPWGVLSAVVEALRPGGRFAGYVPTVHQMEATVQGLREAGFLGVEAMEVLVRPWHVQGRSVRPSFEMQAHTAWLVFARWPGADAAGTMSLTS